LAARKAYAKGEAREQAADDKLWREAEEEANEKAWAKEEAWAKAIWASEAAAKEKIAEKLAASDELRIVSGAGKQAAKDAAARQIADITVSSPQAADRLARIGGIIGGQTSPQQGAMERMAKETEIQTRLAEEIKDIVASMDAKLVALEE